MAIFPLVEFTLSTGTSDIGGEALPDTGFEGGVIIPVGVGREIISTGVLAPWRMADGTVRTVRTWTGTLVLDEHSFRTEVLALGSRYLIGREILDQLEICFQFGRRVTLRFHDELDTEAPA
jgi:predicted aspartyl protease